MSARKAATTLCLAAAAGVFLTALAGRLRLRLFLRLVGGIFSRLVNDALP